MGKFEKGNTKGKKFTTGEEQTEVAKRGGIASGKARHEYKEMRIIAKQILKVLATEGDKSNLKKLGLTEDVVEGATKNDVVVAAQVAKACAGDTRAAAWLRDTLGETEIKIQTEETPTIIVDLND